MSVFEFAGHTLDLQQGRLRRGESDIALRPKSLSLLTYLVKNPSRVIGKDELIVAIWPDVAVSDDSLAQCLNDIRKSLGVEAEGLIRTVPRRGYLFDEARVRRTEPGIAPAGDNRKFQGKASIAVLPFVHSGQDTALSLFADGMADEIIGALSRVRELFVVSRMSSFAYKARAIEAERVARELGVQYVLEGTIRAAGDKLRLGAQLIDGATGGYVWNERYDFELDDIFGVQDEITRNIVVALQVELTQGESARLWEGQTRNLRAWELMVRARDALHRYSTADNSVACRLATEALLIDPAYSGAMALLGIIHYWDARYSMSVDMEASTVLAERQAELLSHQSPDMGATYSLKACIAFLRDRHEEAVALATRAADLAPSDNRVLGFQGMFQIYAGHARDAATSLKAAIRLSPHPETWLIYYSGLAELWLDNLDAAAEAAALHLQLQPEDGHAHAFLAAMYELVGRHDAAVTLMAALRKKNPGFGVANLIRSERYRQPEKLERLLGLLRQAGLEQ